MSNYHATADFDDHFYSAPRPAGLRVLRTLNAWSQAAFTALQAAIVRQRLARLSDHMLRDFGFERDWDGSIRSLRDAE